MQISLNECRRLLHSAFIIASAVSIASNVSIVIIATTFLLYLLCLYFVQAVAVIVLKDCTYGCSFMQCAQIVLVLGALQKAYSVSAPCDLHIADVAGHISKARVELNKRSSTLRVRQIDKAINAGN